MKIGKVILLFLIRMGAAGLDNIGINVVDSLAQVVMTLQIQRIFHSGRMAMRCFVVLTLTQYVGVLATVA